MRSKEEVIKVTWTTTQKQRLRELNVDSNIEEKFFRNPQERNKTFHKVEQILIMKNKHQLEQLRNLCRHLTICQLEALLVDALVKNEFVQVITSIILAKGILTKMSITEEHPLFKQIFWLSPNKCLRSMLAPNLYCLLKVLVRLWKKPIRIFEVGPCFRKDSEGNRHLFK